MLELCPHTPLFIGISITELALGAYVLSLARNCSVNRSFFMFSVFVAIGSFLDMLMHSLTDATMAAWNLRVLIILLVLELGVGYRLVTLVPYDSGLLIKGLTSLRYWSLTLLVAMISALTVGEMQRDAHGWVPALPWPYVAMVTCMLAYTIMLTLSLRRKLEVLKRMEAIQAMIFTFALAFPVVVMALILVLTSTVLDMPRLLGLGELVSVVVISYGIARYDLMVPPRVMEKAPVPRTSSPQLEAGRSYLFESKGPEGMYNALLNRMVEGLPALIISRTHPDQLRSRYELTRTPFLWLAETPGPNNVHPGNLQMLTHMTTEFLKKGPSLVAIDGLEYLLVNNDITRVLKFLGQLRDMAVVEGAILLVTVDPLALSERQRAILERGIDIVIGKEGAETAI